MAHQSESRISIDVGNMCGIAACLNVNGKSMSSVIRALQSLQNRGYDSVGICTGDQVFKAISTDSTSAILECQNSEIVQSDTMVSVGHTRWATHGAKTLANCHPHKAGSLLLVHNGIIENYEEIRPPGEYYGQTDSEVAAKCYAEYGAKAFSMFKGTFAIIVLDSEEPNKLVVAKSGSPLLLGINADASKVMLVSEVSGFDPDIIKYAIIPDGAVDVIEIVDKTIVFPGYPMISVNASVISHTPDPYPHWMLKEIYEQPYAVEQAISIDLPKITLPKHLILSACGTSYHAAQMGSQMFRKLHAPFSVSVIDGADLEPYDILTDSLLIVISQSGETRDLYRALQIAKGKADTLAIVNVEGSLIAREADKVIYTRAGKENAVASTKSFVSQVVVLWRLASQMLGKDIDLSGLSKAIFDAIQPIDIDISQNCFILGKHSLEWIAKEGSLKIKEVSYVHAEGYAASALKHGPFALIDHGVSVIVLCNKDEYYPKLVNVINEVKSRHATVIAISNVDLPSVVDHHIRLDIDSQLFELVSIIPLQMLAYHTAVKRGLNPDYPRNLAKVVTVD